MSAAVAAAPHTRHAAAVRLGEPTAAEILATPEGFAEVVLGLSLYDWQRRALRDFEREGEVSLRCCNEAGKTTYIAAPLILWVMTCFPGAQVVVTSGGERQVKHQLFPALKRFATRFPDWKFDDLTIESAPDAEGVRSRCVGFATNDAGLFEGFHVKEGGHRDTPLLVIVDEAKTVDDTIFQAVDRCRPTWTLLMSSPGGPTGMFYRSQTALRSLYRTHKVTVADCPHVDPEVIRKIIEKYGRNHWFTRSTLDAEFTEDPNDGRILLLADIEKCVAPGCTAHVRGQLRAFCDFAAGGDENVLAVAQGNKVWIERAWRESNTMAAAGEFIALFRRLGLKPEQITGDADGLGIGVLDRMAEQGWAINRLHNNATPTDGNVYRNRAAELWGEAAAKIQRGHVILPQDERLAEQLSTRRWKRISDGVLQLESKEDMRKRGVPSPDRADAVVGALAEVWTMFTTEQREHRTAQEVWDAMEAEHAHHATAGFNAGD